jgi:hypothetical protein
MSTFLFAAALIFFLAAIVCDDPAFFGTSAVWIWLWFQVKKQNACVLAPDRSEHPSHRSG